MHHLNFFQSLACALQGWAWAIAERNVKIHVAFLVAVVGAGLVVGLERWEWITLVLTCGQVISAELLNTAIEWLGDIVSEKHQPAMGKVKDVAAGGVLVAAVTAVIVGAILFGPHLV